MKNDDYGLPDLGLLGGREEPARDLWPEIAAAIGTPSKHARHGRKQSLFPSRIILSAAAVAAALVIGIAAGRTSLFVDSGLPSYVRTVNEDYRKSERQVLYRLEGSALSADTVLEIRENLQVLNRAADRLMELVRNNPDNRELGYRIELVNRERFEFLEAVRALLGGDRDGLRGPSI